MNAQDFLFDAFKEKSLYLVDQYEDSPVSLAYAIADALAEADKAGYERGRRECEKVIEA